MVLRLVHLPTLGSPAGRVEASSTEFDAVGLGKG